MLTDTELAVSMNGNLAHVVEHAGLPNITLENGMASLGHYGDEQAVYDGVIHSFERLAPVTDHFALPALSAFPPGVVRDHIVITLTEAELGATIDGVSAPITTLLGRDQNSGNWWGNTRYVWNITADGYDLSNDAVALIGDAKATLLVGGTIKVTTKLAAPYSNFAFSMGDAEGNNGLDWGTSGTSFEPGWLDNADGIVAILNLGGTNVFVYTMDPGGMNLTMSINGSDPLVIGDTPVEDFPDPIAYFLLSGDDGDIIQEIEIWSTPLATEDHAAASETGIPNTGPTDITIVWTTHPIFAPLGDGTFREDWIGAYIADLTMVDAQNNPAIFTLLDDHDGLFLMDEYNGIVMITEPFDYDDDPTPSFTVRATEPSGLYFDKEFTVTLVERPNFSITTDPATIATGYNTSTAIADFVVLVDGVPSAPHDGWRVMVSQADQEAGILTVGASLNQLRLSTVRSAGTYPFTAQIRPPDESTYYNDVPGTVVIV